MREIKAIVDQYLAPATAGLRKALATVVHVQGSSYRRPGARMLVLEDGRITGAISGGCLENDALRKAQIAMATGEPRLVVYDTGNEEDASFGVQLGCNGVITVLFEPVASEHDPKIKLLSQITESRNPAVAVTVFHSDKKFPHPGTCMVYGRNTKSLNLLPEIIEKELLNHAQRLLEDKKSAHITMADNNNGQLNCFLEFIPPPVSLVIAGAGNDAIPLVKFAEVLGWETQIVDGRHTHLSGERFPPSCALHLAAPEQVLEKISPDPWTAFILVTHNYQYDKALLKYLLPLKVPYIGILGPKKKLDRMISELKDEGAAISEEMMQKIHGPVGLEIGAEHPSEIALAVVAEIQAVINRKEGGFLKNKNTVIHS